MTLPRQTELSAMTGRGTNVGDVDDLCLDRQGRVAEIEDRYVNDQSPSSGFLQQVRKLKGAGSKLRPDIIHACHPMSSAVQ